MIVVFDSMVVAYALLGVTEFRDEATQALEIAEEIWVPDSFRAELVNIFWQWVEFRCLLPKLLLPLRVPYLQNP